MKNTVQELALQITEELEARDILDFKNFCEPKDCIEATVNTISEILEKFTIFNNDITYMLENYRLK